MQNYRGSVMVGQYGQAGSNEIRARVNKSILSLFVVNLRSKWGLDANIGATYSRLIIDGTRGTYNWYHLQYGSHNGALNRKKFNKRDYMALTVRLAYNIPVSPTSFITPQYVFSIGKGVCLLPGLCMVDAARRITGYQDEDRKDINNRSVKT